MTKVEYCNCGNIYFKNEAQLTARFICHCTLCRSYSGTDFYDEAFFAVDDIGIVDDEKLSWQRNFSGRSPVNRGTCKVCDKPAISIIDMPFMKFSLVPADSIPEHIDKKKASCHVFYHRRVNDVDDVLPKYRSYWSSQIMNSWHLLVAILKK